MHTASRRTWPSAAPPPAAPPPSQPQPPAESPIGLRLRHKGLLALLAVISLIALLFSLVLAYRASMEQDFDRLERTRRAGVMAADLAQTQALALSELGTQLGGSQGDTIDVDAIERSLSRLAAQAHALEAAGFTSGIEDAALVRAREDLLQRRDRVALLALRAQLEAALESTGRHTQAREALSAVQVARVHERGRAVAVTLAAAAILGTALVGVVVVFFFTRLSSDIARLRARALAVVAGDRQADRTIERDDELGELGSAIDVMVAALAAREHDLGIERRNVFHQEKMATIGALAAGVLNDIGNPIAAIDGLARAMRDEREAGSLRYDNPLCDPENILRETTRLQIITRQIAELAAPPSSRTELLSLNDVVRSALLLAHFDPRVNGVRIDTEFDPQLPAVDGVGDRLLQLVLNLLVNAADAVRGAVAGSPLISIKTRRHGHGAELLLADNGCGMDPNTLARAFDPLFTTKPAGQGTGLGLPLCREIAQQHGGALSIESTPGFGTQVTLYLPGPEAGA